MVDILVFIEYSIVGTTPPTLANEKAGFFSLSRPIRGRDFMVRFFEFHMKGFG